MQAEGQSLWEVVYLKKKKKKRNLSLQNSESHAKKFLPGLYLMAKQVD